MEKVVFYYEWCRVINEYVHTKFISELYKKIGNRAQEMVDVFRWEKTMLDHAFREKNEKLLKRFFLSTLEMAVNMDASSKAIINSRLRAACGEDLTKYDRRLANSVMRIVKCGKICNGEEYDEVCLFIESIEGKGGQEPLLQKLYQLVDEFEIIAGENHSLVDEEWRRNWIG